MILKISKKLFFFSLVIILLFILTGYLTFISTRYLQKIIQNILRDNVSSLKAAEELELAVLDQKGLVANYLLDGNRKWVNLLEEKKELFWKWFERAKEVSLTEREKQILEDIKRDYRKYDELHSQVINLYRLGNLTEAKRLLLTDVKNYLDRVYKRCEDLLLANEELIARALRRSEIFVHWVRLAVVLSVTLAIFLGLSLGIFTYRSIAKQIIDKEKLASLGKLSAVVAHEIRNPLTAIKMRTQALKGETENLTWQEDLKVITEEITRLEKIVSDFLALAKPQELNLEKEKIKTIIENTLDLLKPKIEAQRIEIIKELQDVEIKLDKERLKQALLNILINSLEAMSEGGRIEISVSLNKKYLEIRIKDTGRGISYKDREKVFEPFFTTKREGLGLGLTIVENIIKMHKGKIRIDSQEGQGTMVSILIPLRS